jgi:hypothetical protein
MMLVNRSDGRAYSERFYDAAVGLVNCLKYLVFFYFVGSAFAVIALVESQAPGSPTFSLTGVLIGYGIAGLALAVFLYWFVKLIILGCCAYGEWRVERSEPDAKPHTDEPDADAESGTDSGAK